MPDVSAAKEDNMNDQTSQVTITFGGEVIGQITVTHSPGADAAQKAATAWDAIAKAATFSVDDTAFSAEECEEWWA